MKVTRSKVISKAVRLGFSFRANKPSEFRSKYILMNVEGVRSYDNLTDVYIYLQFVERAIVS